MNAFHGSHAIALPPHRPRHSDGPSQATVFREGGVFDSPGVAGSGSVATCTRCGGDVALSGPFRRVVLLSPRGYAYEHPGDCPPLLRLAPS